jgi:transposase-like protein
MVIGSFAFNAKSGYHLIMSAKKISGPTKNYNATSRKLKAARIAPVELPLRKGEWQVAKEQKKAVPGMPKTKSHKKPVLIVNDGVAASMALAREEGQSVRQVAQEYGVSESLVERAVRRHYVSLKDGKQALRGVLLEGAIACGQQAKNKVEELNGMQSVVAAGIFTQRFIDMDKHIQESPEEVDMSDVEKAGALIASLDTELDGQLLEDREFEDATIDIDEEEPEH